MYRQEVIDYFGGISKAAAAIGCSRQAIHLWEPDGVIPELWAWKIEGITRGDLRVKQWLYK